MRRTRCPRPTTSRVALAAVVTAAVVSATLTVPGSGAAAKPRPPRALATATAPAGGFALSGGLGGRVDERTGQLSVSVPVTTVGGRTGAGVTMSLGWQQDRATSGIDRSGWGAGWSMGSSFVAVAGLKRVFPADGGSYALDSTRPSGLKNYTLRDLTFTSRTGILPRRLGSAQVSFSYQLAYDDGRTDYFDVNGNLVSRTDRLGNRTDLRWQGRGNNVWRPTSVVDTFGLATTFDYATPGLVKVLSPARSDGVVATTTIGLSPTLGVQSVVDPVGNRTTFVATGVSGASAPLVTQIIGPTGARSAIAYRSLSYQPGLVVVSTLRQTDATGAALSPVQTFDANPTGNDEHNFTGWPNHLGTGGDDALFASGDTAYRYSTALTTGTTTTLSTYDALHRLVGRRISVVPAAGQLAVRAQDHQFAYPTAVVVPSLLPPTYGRPTKVTLTESVSTGPAGLVASPPRTTTTATAYDDHGRVVSATDELGSTTLTEYDGRFGLVTRQTTTGTDGGRSQVVNTLTGDGTNIATSTTSHAAAGATPSARQTLAYTYDDDGQVTSRTLAWAPGAAPADEGPGGGPDTVVTTFDRSVDVAGVVQTVTTTVAAGTPAARTETATVDLVSGKATTHTDALGRTTTTAYDAAACPVRTDSPGGLTTTTAYTPTTTTVTGYDGRVTRTTVDLLGRTTAVTDNVQDGALVASPTARTLSSHAYSADGSSVTSKDQAGRTTTTLLDAFGRSVRQVGPTGLVHRMTFDDGAAHSTVADVLPDGSTQPLMGRRPRWTTPTGPCGRRRPTRRRRPGRRRTR